MNCETELDFTERDKYFGQVGSLFALPNMAKTNQRRIKWSEYYFSVNTAECVSLHITAQIVKQYCDAMNFKSELDFTERDKYF